MAAVLDRVYLCMWLLIEKDSVNQDLKLHAAVFVDLFLCYQALNNTLFSGPPSPNLRY